MPEVINNHSPIELAAKLSQTQDYFIFLHSSMQTNFSGENSIIALGAEEIIKSENFNELQQAISQQNGWQNAWFGYFGYGLKNRIEALPVDEKSYIDTPELFFIKPKTILIFSHQKNEWHIAKGAFDKIPEFANEASAANVKSLRSNMSKADYLQKVSEIREHIASGTIYQANLTRKFYGEFEQQPNGFELFCKLCVASPAPYSAYFKLDGLEIISSSPEQFLKVDANGNAETRPIKGSASKNENLEKSAKDKAENLMITDLMRNDFSRVCEAGSVKTDNLFEIAEYATINHMQSTVIGKLQQGVSALDVVKACFPPGSMTGAPKIKAMEICSHLEKQARGIYSGALGYINNGAEAELSVVIRTIILEGKKFEFQVGGGIIYDSTPEKELQETYIKAKAIAAVLGISEKITLI